MNKIIEEFKNNLDAGYPYVVSTDLHFTRGTREFLEYYKKIVQLKNYQEKK